MATNPAVLPPPPGRAALRLPDGVRIVVPELLDRITPSRLREQGDGFEDEIRFVRPPARGHPGARAGGGARWSAPTLTSIALAFGR
jgi:hypothetical protein